MVAYNSLQSLQVADDMAATVCEAGRVLGRPGRLCACVAHPVTDLGRFRGDDTGSEFVMRRHYFETRRVDDTVQHGGLTMTFHGWTYFLEQYAVALEQGGFHVEAMREPRPTPLRPSEKMQPCISLPFSFRAVKRNWHFRSLPEKSTRLLP